MIDGVRWQVLALVGGSLQQAGAKPAGGGFYDHANVTDAHDFAFTLEGPTSELHVILEVTDSGGNSHSLTEIFHP